MKKHLSANKRFAFALAGMLFLLLMLLSSSMLYSNGTQKQAEAPPRQVFTYATAPDKRQQIHLPDGSILVMNGGTKVSVYFYPDRRLIKLGKGEIAVDAVEDTQRPMIVEGGRGKVLAGGNRFNVSRDALSMDVAVAAGSVKVEGGSWWSPTSKYVNQGMRLQISQASELSDLQRIDRPLFGY